MPSSIFDIAHHRLVDQLRDARLKSGQTQAVLGAKVGKSQSFISLIERHQRRVDVIEFVALSRALGKDPEEAFADLLVSIGIETVRGSKT